MSNKHFCQGPHCHEQVTQDRFLKSRGVSRGRYAYAKIDNSTDYYWAESDKYFCSQTCKLSWLSTNMQHIEQGRPIEFIRHRRESGGYHKVDNSDRWGASTRIERVDNRTEVE